MPCEQVVPGPWASTYTSPAVPMDQGVEPATVVSAGVLRNFLPTITEKEENLVWNDMWK